MGAFLDFRFKWQYQGRSGEIKAGQESLFHRAFVGLREGLVDWAPAFGAMVEDVLEPFISEQFVDQGETGGVTWAKLAESTIEARGGSDYPILINKGNLLHSFKRGGGQHHEEITPKKLVWGSDVPYAMFLHTGTGKGYRNPRYAGGKGQGRGMPSRPIFWEPKSPEGEAINTRLSKRLAMQITMVARQYGFRIGGRGIDAGEAARIGRIALGLRS